MISWKWIKSWTNKKIYARVALETGQDLLMVLVNHIINIVKLFKNLEKQVIEKLDIEMN